jgi:hypothetical protein
MGATLCPLFDLISVDVTSYKDLVVSFVSILKQVAEHRLPKGYDYHLMPAPFIQVSLHLLSFSRLLLIIYLSLIHEKIIIYLPLYLSKNRMK